MFTENGKGTIFDNVKASKIIKATIPEDEIIKPTKMFTVNNDKFDYDLIVNDYKIPSFKYLDDNSLNDFFEYPDIYMSQNTEYRYKYPHLATGEYIKQQWQTEAGTPNELNTFMRQEQTGKTIDDIKAEDNAYASGLQQIQKMIDGENNDFTKAYNDRLNELEQPYQIHKQNNLKDKIKMMKLEESRENKLMKLENVKEEIKQDLDVKHKKALKTYTKKNPVLIKPAIEADKIKNILKENVKQNKEAKERFKNVFNTVKNLDDKITEKTNNKKIAREALEDVLDNVDQHIEDKEEKIKKQNFNKEKSNRYENLELKYNEESKKQIAHENLVLKGYDDVIKKLESVATKELSKAQRSEINQMLKNIDDTNIGAIKQVETAIKRLKSKQQKIEEHKTKILDKIKKQEEERKTPRRVSRNLNIMQVSDLPKNDDESDFSIKKLIKSKGPLPPPEKNKT